MSKTIIITGASSGIGEALAKHLASLNHHVIATGRNEVALEKLQNLYPENIKTVVADLMNSEDWIKIHDAIDPTASGIFLVHNAGIASPKLLSEISEEEWDAHYLTNTKAVVFLTQLLLPYLKNGGRVLNISTGLAHNTLPAMAAYGVSKAATYMWKECCNAELNDQEIYFGSVMPGVVDTPIQRKLKLFDPKEFPAVEIFKGFSERDELLDPSTVAKFLSWLLFDVDSSQFVVGDWNINDTSHHPYWAESNEIKLRK